MSKPGNKLTDPYSFCRLIRRSRSFGGFLAVSAAAALFFSVSSCGNELSVNGKTKNYAARFVVDGDTIELSTGRKARYIGIDTPETRKKEGGEWVFRPEVYAVEAKARNLELVFGKPLELEFDLEKEDKYGRYLAYVYADGVMVNLQLVKEGLATVYTFPPNLRYYREMVRFQKEAFEERRGLWSTIKKIEVSEARLYEGKFCLVEGNVTRVEISSGRIFLHLSSEDRVGLRLKIYSRNLQLFRSEGIDPATYYEGKKVEVFGKVEKESRFPEINIDNPFQIKVL
jgi:micrococcal nuclease